MTLDFTIEQLAILDRALQELPYRIAAPLIGSINEQIAAQQKQMDVPVPLDDETKR